MGYRIMSVSGFGNMYKALKEHHGIDYKKLSIPKPWKKGPWTSERKNNIIRQIKIYKPHFLFMMKDPYFTNLLPLIKAEFPKLKTIMWYGDQRGNIIEPLIAGRSRFLDGLLITNDAPVQLRMYRQIGIKHVYTFYHSFAPEQFQLWDREITHDVFFGGTNFSVSKFPLSLLRRQLIYHTRKNFRLVVHGGGWKFPTEKWVLSPGYAKELRKAHINLGINHYHLQRYYNRRLFEAVASGRLHITYYIPGMEKHFKNHEHLVWFKTVAQAISLISYYLKHDKKREEIAKNGREFFLKYHAWAPRTHLLKKILLRMLKTK